MGDWVKFVVRRIATAFPVRLIAKPIYHLFVRAQLLPLKVIPPRRSADPLDDLTVVIKTFERPAAAARAIASIRQQFPAVRIVLVDDSRMPAHFPGVDHVRLPFDSGVGAGRAAGLARVETPFVLNLDDDMVVDRRSGLVQALAFLRAQPDVDILGATVIDLPMRTRTDFSKMTLFPSARSASVAPGTRVGAAVVMDKVANIFIGRTDKVRMVGWDPALKRLDHADFFTRAKGILVSAMIPGFRMLHYRDPFDRAYSDHRFNIAADGELIARRYYPDVPEMEAGL